MTLTNQSLWLRLTRPWGDPPPADYSWKERLGWAVPAIGIYALGYYAAQYYALNAPRIYDIRLPWDAGFPLRTEFAYGYLMVYFILALMIFIRRREAYFNALRGIVLQSVICFAIYLMYPVKMFDRPDEAVYLMTGAGAALTGLYYSIDMPFNLFPSMHLSVSTWIAVSVAADRPRWKWPLAALVAWVALSVLFTKQHYTLDVVSGLFVAWLTRLVFLPGPAWKDDLVAQAQMVRSRIFDE
jgi:membrane-associated phospholipid phosphatase